MKKHAILIGINDYLVLNNLSYARQDAEVFAQVLWSHCGFSIHEISLMTCCSSGATRATSRFIEDAMADLTEHRDLDCNVDARAYTSHKRERIMAKETCEYV